MADSVLPLILHWTHQRLRKEPILRTSRRSKIFKEDPISFARERMSRGRSDAIMAVHLATDQLDRQKPFDHLSRYLELTNVLFPGVLGRWWSDSTGLKGLSFLPLRSLGPHWMVALAPRSNSCRTFAVIALAERLSLLRQLYWSCYLLED
jgi:hypothetical protein